MKKAFAAAALLGMIGSALYAGGPVIVAEEETVVEEQSASSSGWVIPALLLVAIGVAIASGDDEDNRKGRVVTEW